jgi:uncharacterized protein YukE
MRICDLATGAGQLQHAFGQLKERWRDARAHWDDEAARNFEETFLRPIPARLQHLVIAIDRLAQMVEQAERDCADRGAE